MTRAILVLSVVAGATPAAAGPSTVAYVDEIVVAGGPDRMHARAFASASIRRAGMDPRFADEGTAPCGDAGDCLAERARMFGAAVALRLTVAEVGDRVVVSMLVSDAHGRSRREVLPSTDLHHPDDRLASVLRELVPQAPERPRVGAWALVSASAVLALGGAATTWYAYDLRSRFYREHVAENGDVFGISPADARVEERHARQWSYIGAFALGGAAVAGTGAAIMFIRSSSGETRPAGVTVAWELP